MTNARNSHERMDRFFLEFIGAERMQEWIEEWTPKTNAEYIAMWKDSFLSWLQNRGRGFAPHMHYYPEMFVRCFYTRLWNIQSWHAQRGTWNAPAIDPHKDARQALARIAQIASKGSK